MANLNGKTRRPDRALLLYGLVEISNFSMHYLNLHIGSQNLYHAGTDNTLSEETTDQWNTMKFSIELENGKNTTRASQRPCKHIYTISS